MHLLITYLSLSVSISSWSFCVKTFSNASAALFSADSTLKCDVASCSTSFTISTTLFFPSASSSLSLKKMKVFINLKDNCMSIYLSSAG